MKDEAIDAGARTGTGAPVRYWQAMILALCMMAIGPGIALSGGYQLHTSGQLSWAMIGSAGAISILVGVAIALFARHIVATGSILSYVQLVLPPWAAKLAGASLLLGYIVGPAAAAMQLALYISSILLRMGLQGAAAPLTICLILVATVAASAFCAYRGVDMSAKVATVLGLACLPLAVGTTLLAGSSYGFDVRAALPVEHASAFDWGRGIFVALGLFVGFDGVSAMASESDSPKRDAPRIVLWSICITAAAFTLAALLQTPILVLHQAAIESGESPTAILSHAAGLTRVDMVADVLLCLAGIAALISWLNFAALIIAAGATEGYLPRWLAATHARYRSPYRAVVFLAIVSSIVPLVLEAFARTVPIILLVYLSNVVVLLWLIPYALTCWAAVVLEYRNGRRITWTSIASAAGAVAIGGVLAVYIGWPENEIASTTTCLTVVLVAVAFFLMWTASRRTRI